MGDAADSIDRSTPAEGGVPPPINEESIVFDVDFHPLQPVIACGMVSGCVNIHHYGTQPDQNWRVCAFKFHKAACRAVSFTSDGTNLYTGSSDLSMRAVDCNTAKVTWFENKCHDAPINCVKCFDNNLTVSGDDSGCVKLWDRRTNTTRHKVHENTDFISDLALAPDNHTLIATSGDGHLTVIDTRKGKLKAISEELDDELLSAVIVKHGKKVVCGSQGGVLDIYSFGDWGDMTDRFPGHPQSIDSLVALSEDVIVTGSSDGIVRVVHVHPNKLLGVIGEHGEFPIEKVALSPDKSLIASSSHDQLVKFWSANLEAVAANNSSFLAGESGAVAGGDGDEMSEGEEEECTEDESSEEESSDDDDGDANRYIRKTQKALAKRNDFYADL